MTDSIQKVTQTAGHPFAGSSHGLTMTTTTSPEPTFFFNLYMVITNRVFNESLLNSNSPDYKKMYDEVNGVLNVTFSCTSCGTHAFYRGVKDMKFKHGSVIAISNIMFQTYFINAVVIKNLFQGTIRTVGGNLNGLTIIPDSVQVFQNFPSIPTSTTTTVVTKSPKPTSTATTHKTSTSKTTFTTTNPKTSSLIATNHESTTHTSTSYKATTVTSRAPSKTSSMSSSTSSSTSPSKRPAGETTNKPFSKTTSKHGENISTDSSKQSLSTKSSSSANLSSFSTRRGPAPLLLNTTTGGRDSYNSYERVPGWAVALLVLACIILVLLIILLIIALVRCCTNDKVVDSNDVPEVHTPYSRRAFKEPLSTPSYSRHTPQQSPIVSSFESPKTPRVNRTGMYIVNPGEAGTS
ncbi:hypothetical protein P4O66_019173 [Electrophorus voltai]|uniref:SEA domain-containing protein n=1 Tax=Electrophorus voltai TaxID=2609070 RepID=A0AAD9E7V9_9TELE|nr:hypothetical protein P4O66_019173 [Electrophorus voltai]